jgi:hypothetical protein
MCALGQDRLFVVDGPRVTPALGELPLFQRIVDAQLYTKAKETMLERTHIPEAPWWVVEAVCARPLREPHESRFAALSVSAEEKEVSRRAARYGGRFDGKLKMASGRDRLIAGSILAAPTLFWHIALSNRRS